VFGKGKNIDDGKPKLSPPMREGLFFISKQKGNYGKTGESMVSWALRE
jgi:hypothetical protein